MRFKSHPYAFQTRHWRVLYESCIPDLPTLVEVSASGPAFLVIDVEPWGADYSKPAEIGITLVPPVVGCTSGSLAAVSGPPSLEQVSRCWNLETHLIRVIGRERRVKQREFPLFGRQHSVEPDEIEKTILELVESFQRLLGQSSEARAPLVLTGFAMLLEVKVLSGGLYHQLLGLFSSWLDLQELAKQMSTSSDLPQPGLNQTLKACGFGKVPSDLQGINCQHNAATDTVRTTALLIHFLTTASGSPELGIEKTLRKRPINPRRRTAASHDKRLWPRTRPQPKELFPYTARVSITSGFDDAMGGPEVLLERFAEYDPAAVGMERSKRYGWVCLPSKESLDDFVQRTHGTDAGHGGTWTAVSDYDPSVVPAGDLKELKGRQRLKQAAQADEKREQRRRKREMLAEPACATSEQGTVGRTYGSLQQSPSQSHKATSRLLLGKP